MRLRLTYVALLCQLILSLTAHAQGAPDHSLGDRLKKANVQAQLKQFKVSTYRGLPGGIFNAPVLDKQVKEILSRFKATGLINQDAVYETFLSSTPELELSIDIPPNADIPTFHLKVSKGLIDFITNQKEAANRLGALEAKKLNDNSEAVLAAAIAHELRHAMTPKKSFSTENQMYREFDADDFATRLLFAAGYPPNGMILYLEPWVIMQERSTLLASYARIMDEHPAARFRIAHISDLVDTLSMSKRGKEEMGFDSSDVPEVRSGVLDRTGPESSSKTSFDAIQRKFSNPKYLALSQREKLHVLEQYFTTSKTRDRDSQIAQSIVAVLNEYGRVAQTETPSVQQLDTLIASLGRFRKTLGTVADETSDDSSANVKKQFTDLRALISQRHLEILQVLHPGENLVDHVGTWGTHVDKRVVYGEFIKQVGDAQTVDQLKSLLFHLRDNDFLLNERFPKEQDRNKTDNRNYVGLFYEKIAVRVLDLTKNMESTLNFIENNYLTKGTDSATIEWMTYVSAGLSQYLLTHDDVVFGNFSARLNSVKTAKDRIFNNNISGQQVQRLAYDILLTRRGKTSNANILSREFQYGLGRPFARNTLDRESVLFLHRALGDQATDLIFNDLVVKKYTLSETFALLLAQDPTHQKEWEKIKLGVNADTTTTPQDLGQQTGVMKRSLEASEPRLFQLFAGAQIETLKQSVTTRQKDRALMLLNLYSQAGTYNALPFLGHDQMNVTRPNLPALGQKVLDYFDDSEKFEVFSNLLRLQIEANVRIAAVKVTEARPYILGSFEDMIAYGKITPGVRDEFMRAWDSAVQSGADFQAGKTNQLPQSFFIETRRTRYLLDALYLNEARLLENTPGWVLASIRDFFDYDSKGVMNGPAIELLQKLLVPSKKDLLNYLADPKTESRIQKNFDLAQKLTTIFDYYRGLTELKSMKDSEGLSQDVQLALYVHQPAEGQTKIERQGRKKDVNLTNFLNDADRETILPFGPDFREFVAATAVKRQREEFLVGYRKINQDLEAYSLNRAVSSEDPVEALVHVFSYFDSLRARQKTDEEISRLMYTLLTRSLYLVKSKDQMDTYSSLFAIYAQGHPIIGSAFGGEFLNASPEALMNISAANYRQHFFNLLIGRLNKYDSWTGRKVSLKSRTADLMNQITRYIYAQATRYDYSENINNGEYRPLLFRLWGVKKIAPFLYESEWYRSFMRKALAAAGQNYIKSLVNRSVDTGVISKEKTFKSYVINTPYSQLLDDSIAEYIRTGRFEGRFFTQTAKRERAIELTQLIKSLRTRDETYRFILASYGDKSTSYLQKIKDYWTFYKLYKAAAKVWSPEVIEKLKQVDSLFSQETMRIIETAWDKFAGKSADLANLDKRDALELLKDLWDAFTKIEKPMGSEIALIFPEASRYRDPLLEGVAKSRSTTFKQLDALEEFKSRRNEAPYQSAVKALFELNDRYIAKLSPSERAQVALYLADVDATLSPEVEAKVKNSFYGSANRRKAIKKNGFFLTLEDIKMFFKEVHPEEKLLGFKAMFVSGVSGQDEAQKILTDRLLLADAAMPPFLRAILQIHLHNMNDSERTTLLSWLLANGQRDLKGPQIVKLFVERGGTAAAKLAQLIASHGLNLSPEYQQVLEVFKGEAQSVEKIEFLRTAKKLLPNEKFSQIKTLDRELGSGSMKVGYLATLKDGRKFAIMISREFIEAKTAREFEILRTDLTAIMNRPDLRLDFLPGVEQETERIIKDEMKFISEAKRMREHKEAYEARPLLIRYLGNQVTINIPQPIEGWSSEKILVEEFVEAKGWNQLPAKSFFGWSQEKLAKAAISETLNQMLAYGDPDKLPEGKVILDIDPHERNALAQTRYFGLLKSMVNIDLGQSVYVDPANMRSLIQVVLSVRLEKINEAVEALRPFMNFTRETEVETFKTQLKKSYEEVKDPITALTKSIGETETQGIFLKPEFLYFQKLFATLVGLQSHVSDPQFTTRQAEKIFFWRTVVSPRKGLSELMTLTPQFTRCDLILSFLQRK